MSYNVNILIAEWLKTIVGGKIKPNLFYALFYTVWTKSFSSESGVEPRLKISSSLKPNLKKRKTLVKVKNYLIWNSI